MTAEQNSLLRELAAKYVWWKGSSEALKCPERIAAQVMNLGDYDDVQRLASVFGDDFLRSVISKAEIGQFNARSWHYWHFRLNLAEPGTVPELPTRRLE